MGLTAIAFGFLAYCGISGTFYGYCRRRYSSLYGGDVDDGLLVIGAVVWPVSTAGLIAGQIMWSTIGAGTRLGGILAGKVHLLPEARTERDDLQDL